MKDYTGCRHMTLAWDQVHRDARRLAQHVMTQGPWRGIISIARGGLIPAAILARELDLRTVESLAIASYDDCVQGDAHIVKPVHPDLTHDGAGWMVVDDLVDSGKTARLVKQVLPKSFIATIYAKPEGCAFVDHYAVSVDQNVWLLFPWDVELLPSEPLVRRAAIDSE